MLDFIVMQMSKVNHEKDYYNIIVMYKVVNFAKWSMLTWLNSKGISSMLQLTLPLRPWTHYYSIDWLIDWWMDGYLQTS